MYTIIVFINVQATFFEGGGEGGRYHKLNSVFVFLQFLAL